MEVEKRYPPERIEFLALSDAATIASKGKGAQSVQCSVTFPPARCDKSSVLLPAELVVDA
jgi:hypothetical protein